MFRVIGKTIRFFFGAAALLSFLALLAVLALWRDSRETVHMGRYGGEKWGYYDVAFNQGRVQVTGIRQSAGKLAPHWLTRPVPEQEMMTANPMVIWDFDAEQKEYRAGVVYRKGLAQWSTSGADDEVLSEAKTAHAVIMPAWVAAGALAVLPVLWVLIAIPTRAVRRRRRAALERQQGDQASAEEGDVRQSRTYA